MTDDDSIIECGDLTSGADITIEETEGRNRPYIDAETFDGNNSGEDFTDYFHIDGDPFAIKVDITFNSLKDAYTGENRWQDMVSDLSPLFRWRV